MKNAFFTLATLLMAITTTYGGASMAAENSGQSQIITRADAQSVQKGSDQFFTGTVSIQPLFGAKHPECPVSAAYVTFAPGARSHWHTHPAGQHLVVTEGVGRTGTVEGKIEEFRTGDVLWCPVGVKHWHGAAPDQSMTHLAFTGALPDGKNVEWMEPVTDQQYKGGK